MNKEVKAITEKDARILIKDIDLHIESINESQRFIKEIDRHGGAFISVKLDGQDPSSKSFRLDASVLKMSLKNKIRLDTDEIEMCRGRFLNTF